MKTENKKAVLRSIRKKKRGEIVFVAFVFASKEEKARCYLRNCSLGSGGYEEMVGWLRESVNFRATRMSDFVGREFNLSIFNGFRIDGVNSI